MYALWYLILNTTIPLFQHSTIPIWAKPLTCFIPEQFKSVFFYPVGVSLSDRPFSIYEYRLSRKYLAEDHKIVEQGIVLVYKLRPDGIGLNLFKID